MTAYDLQTPRKHTHTYAHTHPYEALPLQATLSQLPRIRLLFPIFPALFHGLWQGQPTT